MGKPAARVGDMHSGHDCFPPTNAILGSANVKINGMQAMNVGSQYQVHCCPKKGCHQVIQSTGSATVKINGKPAARLGDQTACGAATITGSSNVMIGG